MCFYKNNNEQLHCSGSRIDQFLSHQMGTLDNDAFKTQSSATTLINNRATHIYNLYVIITP